MGDKKILSQLNVVPFVDIIFVLLIIFIISSSATYIDQNINIPEGGENMSSEQRDIEILFFEKSGDVVYMGEVIQLDNLQHYIPQEEVVRLGFDGELDFNYISEQIRLLSENGYSNIHLVFKKS